MRRILGFPLLIAIAMLPIWSSEASAEESVVSTSIQAAVDAAHAGDIVRVPPGTYRENVVVTKDALPISGTHAAFCSPQPWILTSRLGR